MAWNKIKNMSEMLVSRGESSRCIKPKISKTQEKKEKKKKRRIQEEKTVKKWDPNKIEEEEIKRKRRIERETGHGHVGHKKPSSVTPPSGPPQATSSEAEATPRPCSVQATPVTPLASWPPARDSSTSRGQSR